MSARSLTSSQVLPTNLNALRKSHICDGITGTGRVRIWIRSCLCLHSWSSNLRRRKSFVVRALNSGALKALRHMNGNDWATLLMILTCTCLYGRRAREGTTSLQLRFSSHSTLCTFFLKKCIDFSLPRWRWWRVWKACRWSRGLHVTGDHTKSTYSDRDI